MWWYDDDNYKCDISMCDKSSLITYMWSEFVCYTFTPYLPNQSSWNSAHMLFGHVEQHRLPFMRKECVGWAL